MVRGSNAYFVGTPKQSIKQRVELWVILDGTELMCHSNGTWGSRAYFGTGVKSVDYQLDRKDHGIDIDQTSIQR